MRPLNLFLIGTLLAQVPYFIWFFYGANQSYSFAVTYNPLIIWIIGFCGLVLGSTTAFRFIGSIGNEADSSIKFISGELFIDENKVYWLAFGLAFLIFVVNYINYGGIPLLGYLDGGESVGDVNDRQETALYGVLGATIAALFVVNALFVWLLYISFDKKEIHIVDLVKLLFLFAVLFILNSFAGKRQGIFILFFTAFSYFIIKKDASGGKKGWDFWNWRIKDFSGFIIGGVSILVLIFVFSWLSSLRVRREFELWEGAGGLVSYLEFPLINFEVQCESQLNGHGGQNPLGPLKSFIPYKTMVAMTEFHQDAAPRAEAGIGAGMWGDLYWYWGISGVAGVSFLIGFFYQWLYRKALQSDVAKLCYAHAAWTLIAANSYCHFMSPIFFWLPILGICVSMWFLQKKSEVISKEIKINND